MTYDSDSSLDHNPIGKPLNPGGLSFGVGDDIGGEPLTDSDDGELHDAIHHSTGSVALRQLSQKRGWFTRAESYVPTCMGSD